MESEIPEKHRRFVEAILLVGSTARKEAREDSDIDLVMATSREETFNSDVFKKITGILNRELGEIKWQWARVKPIFANPISRSNRFIISPSPKHPGSKPAWMFVYSRDERSKRRISSILNVN